MIKIVHIVIVLEVIIMEIVVWVMATTAITVNILNYLLNIHKLKLRMLVIAWLSISIWVTVLIIQKLLGAIYIVVIKIKIPIHILSQPARWTTSPHWLFQLRQHIQVLWMLMMIFVVVDEIAVFIHIGIVHVTIVVTCMWL